MSEEIDRDTVLNECMSLIKSGYTYDEATLMVSYKYKIKWDEVGNIIHTDE